MSINIQSKLVTIVWMFWKETPSNFYFWKYWGTTSSGRLAIYSKDLWAKVINSSKSDISTTSNEEYLISYRTEKSMWKVLTIILTIPREVI